MTATLYNNIAMAKDDNWSSQMKKGALELCIMTLIKQKERYGYDLASALSETGDMLITEGTIYPLLRRLKKEGLIDSRWEESETGPPRKYYSLTQKGEQVLREMTEQWVRFSASVARILKTASKTEGS